VTYIHTGLLAAILLNPQRVDFVVGGCGTGQGFLNSAMQYPGVFCGHIINSLDAWLFTQINGGNCISLMLNQGYGWAADVNLFFIFDRILSVESGAGYPPHRRQSQQTLRQTLSQVSTLVQRPLQEIIVTLPDDLIRPALEYPVIQELIDADTIEDEVLNTAFLSRMTER
jgi:ribose 5-phosphate isomerase RpiB